MAKVRTIDRPRSHPRPAAAPKARPRPRGAAAGAPARGTEYEAMRRFGLAVSLAFAAVGVLVVVADGAGLLGGFEDALAARFGPDAVGRAVDRPAKASPSARVKRGEP